MSSFFQKIYIIKLIMFYKLSEDENCVPKFNELKDEWFE